MVGRRLMMHPDGAAIGVYEDELESWMGTTGSQIASYEFYESDTARGFVRGAKWTVLPTGGPQGIRAGLESGPVEDRWGPALHRRTREVFGRSFEWGIIAEDLPDESNSVSLSAELRDSSGLPAPKITYRTSENTRALIAWHLDRAEEAHAASGATRTVRTSLMRDSGWHLLGTTRMGEDPGTSVVDGFGRAHEVPNLFVMDGSVFVTSAGVNPTATIAALAIRCTEHLIEQASHQKVPS
jgi:choline dehydrogenase-like flavoprotein